MTETNHKAVAVIEKREVERMHPVVRAAMQGNPDPETLGKLLDLQERYEAGEAKKAYTAALVSLKADLPTVIKRDMTVAFQGGRGAVRYTHTSLAAVMDAVTDPLARHGFSLGWNPHTDAGAVHVTCTITHAAGHSESTTISAPVDKSGSKSDAQGVASTITLLSRYTALALLGIATREMKEPEGETPPDLVDSARNLKAVKFVVDQGYTKKDAEKLIGKPAQAWTAADLNKLREWIMEIESAKGKKSRPAKKSPTKKQEAPHDAETGEVKEGEHDYGPPALTEEEAASMREPGEEG